MMLNTVNRQQASGRGGYSLLEVLIGMVILAIGLASAFAMSVANSRLVEKNQNIASASNLAEAKIEEMRNTSFDSLADGSDGPLNSLGQADSNGIFTRAWTVSEGAPSLATSDLKTAVVVVTWNQWGQTRTYSLTGVIGKW
jgi:prepilin-type N-terminal cleavage/methylation domain-containing protein